MATIDFTTPVVSGGCGAPLDGSSCRTAIGRWQTFAYNPANHPPTLTISANGGIAYNTSPNGGFCFQKRRVTGWMGPDVTIAAEPGTKVTDFGFIGTQDVIPVSATTLTAKINSVAAGSTKVVLKTPSQHSKFRVGMWVIVNGIDIQPGGFPPNWQRFEFHKITAINTSTGEITLDGALRYSHSDHWPSAKSTPHPDQAASYGGPASIAGIYSQWDQKITIQNIEDTNTDGAKGWPASCREILMRNVKFNNGGATPSSTQIAVYQNCQLNGAVANHAWEVDKQVDYVELDNCTAPRGVQFQSSSIDTAVIKNGSNLAFLAGTPLHMNVDNSHIGFLYFGALANGRSEEITFTNGATISGAGVAAHVATFSLYTYVTDGILRTPKPEIESENTEAYSCFVPGFKYVACGYYSGAVNIYPDSGSQYNFCVTDMWDDGTFIYIQTDLTGAIPTQTYLGNPSNTTNGYFCYPQTSITPTTLSGIDFTNISQVGGQRITAIAPGDPCAVLSD